MTTFDEVMFAGDWHGNHQYAARVIRQAGSTGIRRILHAGDFGYLFETAFVRAISIACSEANVEVDFIDGNHDKHRLLNGLPLDGHGMRVLAPRVRFIPRGHRFEIDSVTFLGLGGGVSVDRHWREIGKEWWLTEELTEQQIAKAIDGGAVDVMLTHDTADKYVIPGLGDPASWPEDLIERSEAHRSLIGDVVDAVKPKLLVHGHYHVRYDADRGSTRIVGLDMDDTEGNLWVPSRLDAEYLKMPWLGPVPAVQFASAGALT